jgi:hypothetical protein
MKEELVSFRYESNENRAFVKPHRFIGAFVKIGSRTVAVQPDTRRILFPHIGYPTAPGTHAISIKSYMGERAMGKFEWEAFEVSNFSDALDFTFIDGTTKNTSWFPSNDNTTYKPLHARLYNITGHPFDYYTNGMLGKESDTDLLQSTSTTIYPNTDMGYIHDVPVLHSNDKRIWVSDIASHLETKDNASISLKRDNRAMYEKDGDGKYDYPTVAAMVNNHDAAKLLIGDTFEDAKTILMGYLDDKDDIYQHIAKPTSSYVSNINRAFLTLRVMRGHLLTEDEWKTNALDVAAVEEIDRLDDSHLELIDGMWVPITVMY